MALLFRFLDGLAELLDRVDLRRIQRILRDIAPERRRIQRIFASAHIHLKCIFRRGNLTAELRTSALARGRLRQIRWTTPLPTELSTCDAGFEDDRPIVRGRMG